MNLNIKVMVTFNYRCQNEKGEWETHECETSFKSVKDFMKKASSNDELCDWLENEHVVVFWKQVSDVATKKCPLK